MKPSAKFCSWIKKRGVRQTAADIGVDRVSVYRWLSGEDKPGPENVKALARLAASEKVALVHADFGYKLPALT